MQVSICGGKLYSFTDFLQGEGQNYLLTVKANRYKKKSQDIKTFNIHLYTTQQTTKLIA